MSAYKILLTSCSFCALCASGLPASPLVSIGDNADVYFTGSSSARWTSNVFRDEVNESEDVILSYSPGLEVNIGRGLSNLDVVLRSGFNFVSYTENSNLDAELFSVSGLVVYGSSRWDVNGSLTFAENQSATGEANAVSDLILTEDVKSNIATEYRLSPKFSLGSGISYQSKEYISPKNQFANTDSFSLPADIFYKWTPKVDLSLGYLYSNRDVDSYDRAPSNPADGLVEGYSTTTHFLNIGARGVLLPKLTGFFKIGYNTRDSDSTGEVLRNKSQGSLGLDADLAWATTAKLTNNFKFSRDFDVSGDGNSTEVSSFTVSSIYLVSSFWSIASNVGYTLRSYQDGREREDNQYSAGINANYTLNQYWSFSGGYSYSDNQSDQAGNNFTDHVLSISASLRY